MVYAPIESIGSHLLRVFIVFYYFLLFLSFFQPSGRCAGSVRRTRGPEESGAGALFDCVSGQLFRD